MKRSFIKWKMLVVMTIGLTVILSGCSAGNTTSSTDKPTTSEAANASKENGGELTFALAGSPNTLDVGLTSSDIEFRIGRNIFDSLVGELPDHTIKPWLAQSWEISPDQKSYTFKLRQDVTFHDGTPFNAAAVKANFDRSADPKGQSVYAKQLLGPYESSEVIDEFTVKVNFKEAFTPFLSNAAKSTLGIQSPESFKKYGDKVGQNPVGTGPFKFVSWAPNAEIVLEKNAGYNWPSPAAEHSGPAYLDKLVLKLISEEATRVSSLQSGQVLAAESIPAQNVVALSKDSRYQVQQVLLPGGTFALTFNNEKAPWSDVHLRKAVQSAIDVDSIVNSLYLGTFPRAWSALSPSTLGYDSSLENGYKVDVEKANQLLEEAGWKVGADSIREKDGKPLTLNYIDLTGNREKREDIIKMVQQQLKAIGVKMNISITAAGPYVDALKSGGYDLAGLSFAGGDPDILRTLFSKANWSTNEFANSNFARFYDPEIEKLLKDAYQEADQEKRIGIYKELQQYFVQNAVTIPMYVYPYTVASSKNVSGIAFDFPGYPVFYDAAISN
ncbi:ABC transporter substrate-binding protein [Paenibacillus radicis (ex Gao et al. 2016)]|uniref:Peptide ABC transporter substrate-binding protein n=1 Tax=Paenibacillus radicis (ex Gao et al. 2016) TaxID=1737354 RepID=A0A917LZT4_9BACL|nr:ABC transporter substrate-binding protein [Paenibacillus radicis (ex Gao et al. 2016)]GGG68094.1 peptide ABC transporter substrate-binding protein [Paenibacillus radicis (ex Gao et al. 2016)]